MRIILLISTTTYRAEAFLEAARGLGLEVVPGIDVGPALAAAGQAELGLDFRNLGASVRSIRRYTAARPVRAVVPIDDSGTVLAARASAALGLPHNPVEATVAARDKYRMRELLSSAGVPSPEHRLFAAGDDPVEAARKVPYPCVLKPVSLSGSRGVIRADDPDQFVAAWERLGRIMRAAARESHPDAARQVLVERFIPGFEVALEGMLAGGRLTVLALFDKPDPLDGPFFEETIYVTPSRLPDATQAAIAGVTGRAAAALGLSEGPVHAELRVNEEGAWIVEIASRSIGGLCSRSLTFGTGMALEELILRHAVGLPIPSTRREGRAAGVMMIPVPGSGILEAVSGVEEAERVPGIEGVALTCRPGHPLVPLPEGSSYPGFIFARGKTPAAVEASLRAAHAALRFEIAPELPVVGRPAERGR
jgi:biotin carboxylase